MENWIADYIDVFNKKKYHSTNAIMGLLTDYGWNLSEGLTYDNLDTWHNAIQFHTR